MLVRSLNQLDYVDFINVEMAREGAFWSRLVVGGVSCGALFTTLVYSCIGEM